MSIQPTQPSPELRPFPQPDPIHVWDRQMGESAEAFEAFGFYLDAGPDRTLTKTASRVGKTLNLLKEWSALWHWNARARRYDGAQDDVRREQHRGKLDKMYDTHARICDGMAGKLVQRIRSLDVEAMTARDVAVWFKIIVDVQRVALGERRHIRRKAGRPYKDDGRPIRFPNGGQDPVGEDGGDGEDTEDGPVGRSRRKVH